MKDLLMESTKSTPYIFFDADKATLHLKGESFPENAAKFYNPLLDWAKAFIEETNEIKLRLEFEIVYFNSSTSKIFLTLFELMEKGVNKGKDIKVVWRCDKENEIAMECGEEFKEELSSLPFEIETY